MYKVVYNTINYSNISTFHKKLLFNFFPDRLIRLFYKTPTQKTTESLARVTQVDDL